MSMMTIVPAVDTPYAGEIAAAHERIDALRETLSCCDPEAEGAVLSALAEAEAHLSGVLYRAQAHLLGAAEADSRREAGEAFRRERARKAARRAAALRRRLGIWE